jgi:hypothetical protein
MNKTTLFYLHSRKRKERVFTCTFHAFISVIKMIGILKYNIKIMGAKVKINNNEPLFIRMKNYRATALAYCVLN